MGMTNICITQKIFPEAVELLEQSNFSIDYHSQEDPMSASDLLKVTKQADGVICLLTDPVDESLIQACPNLRIISNVAVGYDNIDVNAATNHNIIVTNTPDVLTETTADLAFGLMLAAARRIPEADVFMRAGHYKKFKLYQDQIGIDVYGKTIGIVGMGRIGSAVARRAALGFGMKVVYTSRSPKPGIDAELNTKQVTFKELLQTSDFVSIHTPLTSETKHLFTVKEFRQMRQNAIIINVARGPIIKEDDLAEALEQGMIRGAGLDVYEHEPLMNPRLEKLKEHLVLTPHIGSASIETRRAMSMMAAQNIIEFFAGNRPPNMVNSDVFKP
jgi:glyoxylate reductase